MLAIVNVRCERVRGEREDGDENFPHGVSVGWLLTVSAYHGGKQEARKKCLHVANES